MQRPVTHAHCSFLTEGRAAPRCSEGDGLSGLVADVFNSHLVVQSSAAWVERHRALIQACLASAAAAHSISWRPSAAMLAEEGLVAPDLPPPAEEQPEVCVWSLGGESGLQGAQMHVHLCGGQ